MSTPRATNWSSVLAAADVMHEDAASVAPPLGMAQLVVDQDVPWPSLAVLSAATMVSMRMPGICRAAQRCDNGAYSTRIADSLLRFAAMP